MCFCLRHFCFYNIHAQNYCQNKITSKQKNAIEIKTVFNQSTL